MQPPTVGDPIRRRLKLKMLHTEAADELGVNNTTVLNWEANIGSSENRCMPATIRFLVASSLEWV